MRLRNADDLRQRKLYGRNRGIVDDDFSLEEANRGPGIGCLRRGQLLAATLGHAAALRDVPRRATLP